MLPLFHDKADVLFALSQDNRQYTRVKMGGEKISAATQDDISESGASRVLESELSARLCNPRAVFDKHAAMPFKSLCPIRFSAHRSLSMYIYHFAAKHQSIADTVTLDVP